MLVGGTSLAATGSSAQAKATIDPSCVATAIAKRDNAVISARDAQHDGIVSALKTRITELSAAWSQTDRKARRVALKTAWQDYNNAAKTANKTYNSARIAAWKQYQSDAKACHATNGDDQGSAGVDAQ